MPPEANATRNFCFFPLEIPLSHVLAYPRLHNNSIQYAREHGFNNGRAPNRSPFSCISTGHTETTSVLLQVLSMNAKPEAEPVKIHTSYFERYHGINAEGMFS